MNISEMMTNLKSPDGTWSEKDIDDLSRLSGKSRKELFEMHEKGSQPAAPDGKPAQWKRDVKLKFIQENGHDAYKALIKARN